MEGCWGKVNFKVLADVLLEAELDEKRDDNEGAEGRVMVRDCW